MNKHCFSSQSLEISGEGISFKPVPLPPDHFEAGKTIGARSRAAMETVVLPSPAWRRLSKWIGSERLGRMRRAAEAAFPDYMAEIRGIAAGCGLPEETIFLWNARGDLMPVSDGGCTSIFAPTRDGCLIGHNEDGAPGLRGHCFLTLAPAGKDPGHISFTYPATLNGNTFALTGAGIIQTINNIRCGAPGDGVPRQFLARAALDCRSLSEAEALFSRHPRAGSFHHIIGQAGADRGLSVEYSANDVSVLALRETPFAHANHFIHPTLRDTAQKITASSAARQRQADRLCAALPSEPEPADIRRALSDQSDPDLPIQRLDPLDPDGENTLATAVFDLSENQVKLAVYAPGAEEAVFRYAPITFPLRRSP